MTTPISNPIPRLAQLFKQHLDYFESRISTLEFQARSQSVDTEFSQQFDALMIEFEALSSVHPPTS